MGLFGEEEEETSKEKEKSYTLKELAALAKIFRSAITKKKK